MHLVTLNIIAKKRNNIIWREIKRKNTLHPQGKQLLLSSTFLQEVSELPTVNQWYIGLDNRLAIGKSDTLKETTPYEPTSKDYARIHIGESCQFESFWQESHNDEDPPEFTITTKTEIHPNKDWGIVRNFFLANVKEGTKGILVSSIPLNKPRDMDKETFLTIEWIMNLTEKPSEETYKETEEE